jgi:adrenodoxin-NADP+ reductase
MLLNGLLSRCVRRSGSEAVIKHRQYHVAIVGSGPAAFYTAKYLFDKEPNIKIDMIEKLPIPFGLVRYGVAPDHPEVKSVADQFEEVVALAGNKFRYFGNLKVRDDGPVTLDLLRKHYAAVVLAYGAASDVALSIPNNKLEGILSARKFVNWYNGHPAYASLGKDLDLSNVKDVVIVGQGNVALDCARVLAKSYDELYKTDIAPGPLEILKNSAVERISVVGRRGHIQASFTIKEFRELTKLDNAKLIMYPEEIEAGLTDASKAELKDTRAKTRIVELISKVANESPKSPEQQIPKSHRILKIRYLHSPKEFISDSTRVQALEFEKTKLTGEAHSQSVIGTGQLEKVPCQLVLESIGYRALPCSDSLPFCNKTHTVLSLKGRVVQDRTKEDSAEKCLYAAGWLRRGPTGIIGTNIPDAKETVGSILEDVQSGVIDTVEKSDPLDGIKGLSDDDVVSWKEYLVLKGVEESRGKALDPPRPGVKLTNISEILKIVKDSRNKN